MGSLEEKKDRCEGEVDLILYLRSAVDLEYGMILNIQKLRRGNSWSTDHMRYDSSLMHTEVWGDDIKYMIC